MFIEKTSMIKNTALLLDIDDTIFATDLYKEALASKLAVELGYQSADEFSPIFRQLLKATIVARLYFDPIYFLEVAYTVRKKETTLERLDEIFWDRALFASKLYPEVEKVLELLSKNQKVTLGILSTGDTRHQLQKISSVQHFFRDSNINVFTDKIAVMGEVLKKYQTSQIVIVDDRREILKRVKLLNPSAKVFLMCRGELAKDAGGLDGIFTNLHDILSIIN